MTRYIDQSNRDERRLRVERRRFRYSVYIPERRKGIERRLSIQWLQAADTDCRIHSFDLETR
jgi:hypothetical protein